MISQMGHMAFWNNVFISGVYCAWAYAYFFFFGGGGRRLFLHIFGLLIAMFLGTSYEYTPWKWGIIHVPSFAAKYPIPRKPPHTCMYVCVCVCVVFNYSLSTVDFFFPETSKISIIDMIEWMKRDVPNGYKSMRKYEGANGKKKKKK